MHAPLRRCLAVGTLATAAAAALVLALLPTALAPATRFDEALVRLCAGTGVLVTCWLWVVTVVAVAEAATGIPARGVPTPVRRLVLAACGVAVLAGLAVPAQATPGEQHRERRPVAVLAGLPLPDRAVAPPAQAVVVASGDTLWDLAAADLGPGADAAEIDARWREIYRQNRSVIGSDPDLIQPAQRLRLPAH